MDKEKIIELIKKRIKDDEKDLNREIELYEKSKKYAYPDYSYYNGKKAAFKVALELIGMLDKNNK